MKLLELMKNEIFDCVVLDLNLPDMTGADFLTKLNQSHSHVPPVIIYTGQDVSRDQEKILRKFSESIILKRSAIPGTPFRRSEFISSSH